MNSLCDTSTTSSTVGAGGKKRGRSPCNPSAPVFLCGLAVAILLQATTVAFQCAPPIASSRRTPTTALLMTKKRAGSFFNPVPDDNEDDNNAKNNSREMADKLRDVLKQQQQAPTGFGKPQQQQASVQRDAATNKPYIGIGPPPPRRNDVTKPEYDEQGYTLYADEQTGERSRVFEALVDYPCDFTLKIVGAQDATFVSDMVAIVARTCETKESAITHSTKHNGKWTSVTVQAPVQNAEMLYQLYANIDEDPRVKFKF